MDSFKKKLSLKTSDNLNKQICSVINEDHIYRVDHYLGKESVQNIVASGSIDLNLNLNILALQLENTEYEPEQFPGLVYKLDEPTTTFLLFSNGKLVCTGTKNRQQLEDAMKQLNKNIKEVLKRLKK